LAEVISLLLLLLLLLHVLNMSSLPILYVLVGVHGGPQFSPTVFKSLLCLYHKRVQFEIRELVWTELRAKKEAWKTDRPTRESPGSFVFAGCY
jgi:hypothetical protein